MSADTRNRRSGITQMGEVEPGNLVQFVSNAQIEDSGVSLADLRAEMQEMRDAIEKLTKARRKTE